MNPCGECVFVTSEFGTYSLAGMQLKLSGTLVCSTKCKEES